MSRLASARPTALVASFVFVITLPFGRDASAVVKTWDGGAGNASWTAANNWNPDGVPGPGDDVVIDVPGALTVSLSGGANSITSLTLADGLTVSGGSLAIAGASSVSATGTLALTGGTLDGSGSIDIAGAFLFSGGTLDGAGVVTVAPSGTLALSTAAPRTLSRELRNQGSGSWTLGQWNFADGRFVNESTFVIDTAAGLTAFGITPIGAMNVFENTGVLTKTGPATASFSVSSTALSIENSGLIEVLGGELQFNAGGTAVGGEVTIGVGRQLVLNGTHDFDVASMVSGEGTLRVAGGATDFDGDLGATTSVSVVGGTLSMETSATTSGSIAVSGGTLDGVGDLSFGGASSWNGGTLSGAGTLTIAAGGTLSLAGATKTLSRTLVNAGEATWTVGQMNFSDGTIVNQATFVADAASALTAIGVPPGGAMNVFRNEGLFRKLGAGTLSFTVSSSTIAFDNIGDVEILAGQLSLNAGGAAVGGDVTLASGLVLELNGQHTFDAGATVSGPGTLRVVGGQTTFGGTLGSTTAVTVSGGALLVDGVTTSGPLTLSGGDLGGGGALSPTGASQWTAGEMSGAGVTTIPVGATLSLSGSSKTLGRTLVNAGTATWTLGQINFSNGTLHNTGLFVADTASTIIALGITPVGAINRFDNDGIFRKQGVGSVNFAVSSSAAPFDNSGTIELLAGQLQLASGGAAVDGAAELGAGLALVLNGTHTFDAGSSMTGAGTMQVIGGTTTFDGTLGGATSVAVTGGALLFESDATTTGSLTVTGGMLDGAGVIGFAGASAFSGGTMAGAGTTTILAGGTLAMSGSTKTIARTLMNAGTTTWTAGQMNFGNGTLVNQGAFVATTATLLTALGATPPGAINAFQNNGLFTKEGAGTVTFSVSSSQLPFTNSGTVDVRAGVLTLGAGFPNFAGGTLAGGTCIVAGTLQWPGANVATLAADLRLDGPGSMVRNSTNMLSALGALATIAAAGEFALLNDRDFTTGGALLNQGVVSIDDTCVLTVAGAYTQAASGVFETIFGADDRQALLYGRMVVSGTATLAGLVRAVQSDGFVPANCDRFDIVEAASVVGAFTSQDLPPVSTFPLWTVDYTTIGSPQLATLTFVDVDLNDDRMVNGADLGIMLGSWGASDVPSDLNCDGIVDGADIGILLSTFGARPE